MKSELLQVIRRGLVWWMILPGGFVLAGLTLGRVILRFKKKNREV